MDLLVAVDGSDSYAEQVVEFVAPWLRVAGGRAHLLTVLDAAEIHATRDELATTVLSPLGTDTGVSLGLRELLPRMVEDRTQAIARVESEIRERLEGLAARHLAGIPYDLTVVADDDTARAIVGMAETLSADAVAIGRRGRGARSGVYLGAIADAVLLDSPVAVVAI
jgi:nucleotide-binding universal stress UspA family protein